MFIQTSLIHRAQEAQAVSVQLLSAVNSRCSAFKGHFPFPPYGLTGLHFIVFDTVDQLDDSLTWSPLCPPSPQTVDDVDSIVVCACLGSARSNAAAAAAFWDHSTCFRSLETKTTPPKSAGHPSHPHRSNTTLQLELELLLLLVTWKTNCGAKTIFTQERYLSCTQWWKKDP